jgi:hypothetical protein
LNFSSGFEATVRSDIFSLSKQKDVGMWTRSVLLTIALFGSQSSAWAQSTVSLGYQYLHLTTPDADFGYPIGFAGDFGRHLTDTSEVIGTIDWGRYSRQEAPPITVRATNTITTVGGGIRWRRGSEKARFYAQGVVGLAHSKLTVKADEQLFLDDSTNVLMFQLGGGVEFPVGNLSAFAQADYRHLFPKPSDNLLFDGADGIRLSFGGRLTVR